MMDEAEELEELRDHFAEAAMRELLKQPQPITHPVTDCGKHLASLCYYLADAMIEARNKK